MRYQVNLLALDVKRWVLESKKIIFMSYLVLNGEETNIQFDSLILKPGEMLEKFMVDLRLAITNDLKSENEKIQIEFDNESYLRQKLLDYFKKISHNLKDRNRNTKRRSFITHLDMYGENEDISFLPERTQFFVTLNWSRRYYNREDYKRAIEPLRKLIKLNPHYGLAYKWLARSLKKIRKYDEAMRYYQKYADVDGSIDSLLDLAKSYRKGKIFDKSEEIYQNVLERDPENREARIGLAQIKYALKQPEYLCILQELHKEHEIWLKKWLVEEFNFRIYIPEKTFLTPLQTTRLLGFRNVYELTQRAFKNELPSHFNPTRARLSFFKEEIENWAEVMNRFHCLENEIRLYPENLENETIEANVEERSTEDAGQNGSSQKSNKSYSSRVEEIIEQIRAQKARRAAQQAEKLINDSSREEIRDSHQRKSAKVMSDGKRKQSMDKETAKNKKQTKIHKKTSRKKILSEVEN